ncbi:chromosome partitioning CobQ/CobB/MinD/ParA domain-containing protein (plasmid) [Rhizobium etli 8C-3]|uniref:Chromosome partitioning CobQ/CobB/MinD/ParA domain-containing protein n=1 Tax=Rhizobium etli 8C-3 TaxID=538025 RepID=A0A1L5PAF2_RHIET|nr:chromosome partitioning CobQ/CobB/MinD/ParA domain-containing protein [Rhizobium etli 8C-3]
MASPASCRAATRKRGTGCRSSPVASFEGSGKTTYAVHLAQHLALSGRRILAIDLDPLPPSSTITISW